MNTATEVIFVVVTLAGGIFGVGLSLYALWGSIVYDRCPSCRHPWSRKKVGSKVVDQFKATGLVTRQSHGGGSTFIPGKGVIYGTFGNAWKERVPVVVTVIETTFKCPRCQHTWAETREHEEECFD